MANYAARSNGVLVGAHTILEMDENRSSGNQIFLKNVGEEAGVQQFTGEITFNNLTAIFEADHQVFLQKINRFSNFQKFLKQIGLL